MYCIVRGLSQLFITCTSLRLLEGSICNRYLYYILYSIYICVISINNHIHTTYHTLHAHTHIPLSRTGTMHLAVYTVGSPLQQTGSTLCLVNSLVNPVVYAIYMPRFRKAVLATVTICVPMAVRIQPEQATVIGSIYRYVQSTRSNSEFIRMLVLFYL